MSRYSPAIRTYQLARVAAVKRLIAAHPAEFDLIFREEKVKAGITPRKPKSERIAELEAQLAKLKGTV